jgi:metal-responsive CopG/Arc/MetJ family transcriptional regulator
MDKTTVYLTVELKTGLRRVARERGVSEAEVIREAIRHAVASERPRPRPGVFAGNEPVAREADLHLRGFGER